MTETELDTISPDLTTGKHRTPTPKQQNAIDLYTDGKSKQDAYATAYNYIGKNARFLANALFTKSHILYAIEKHLKKAEALSLISASEVLTEERKLAFSNVGELIDKTGNIIPLQDLPKDIQAALSGVDIDDTIKSVTDKAGGVTETILHRKYKYKLWDKGKSVERLERHLGLFEKDNLQKTQPPSINVNFAGVQATISKDD